MSDLVAVLLQPKASVTVTVNVAPATNDKHFHVLGQVKEAPVMAEAGVEAIDHV